MPPDAPRQGLGSFFRALMDFVDKQGLREQVRAAVSPSTKCQERWEGLDRLKWWNPRRRV